MKSFRTQQSGGHATFLITALVAISAFALQVLQRAADPMMNALSDDPFFGWDITLMPDGHEPMMWHKEGAILSIDMEHTSPDGGRLWRLDWNGHCRLGLELIPTTWSEAHELDQLVQQMRCDDERHAHLFA